MFGIGMQEMLVICAVALLVFGPNELPKIAKKIAKGVQELRRASEDLKRSIDLEGDDDDDDRKQAYTPPRIDDERAPINGSLLTEQNGDANGDEAPRIVAAGEVAVGAAEDDAPIDDTEAARG